jgi:hypothetical protein
MPQIGLILLAPSFEHPAPGEPRAPEVKGPWCCLLLQSAPPGHLQRPICSPVRPAALKQSLEPQWLRRLCGWLGAQQGAYNLVVISPSDLTKGSYEIKVFPVRVGCFLSRRGFSCPGEGFPVQVGAFLSKGGGAKSMETIKASLNQDSLVHGLCKTF